VAAESPSPVRSYLLRRSARGRTAGGVTRAQSSPILDQAVCRTPSECS
jgi:hypothetical protein